MSEHFAQYLAMGGYAAFIWPTYGVAALLLAVLFVLSARRLRAAENALPKNPAGDQDSADDA
jgi:heme exporter protein D